MGKPLEVRVGELFRARTWTLALAESCTGGLVGHLISNVPGSSDYYLGGVTAYSNAAKENMLGVRSGTLARFGAVSRECALEMARGARKAFRAGVGLSVTGIAGPGGGTPGKPVGTVWIGLSTPQADEAWLFRFSGERTAIKAQAAKQALTLLVDLFSASQPDLQDKTADRHSTFQPVEVESQDNGKGKLIPTSFDWKGTVYQVDATGRFWDDDDGQHILVQVPGGRVFELLFASRNGGWYGKSASPDRART